VGTLRPLDRTAPTPYITNGDLELPPSASLSTMEVSPAGTASRARLPPWTASQPSRNGPQRPSCPETPAFE